MIKQRLLLFVLLFLITARGLNAQCAGITFTASDTIGCNPLVSVFNAQNFPVGSEFSWDFGSGYSSQSLSDSMKTNIFNSVGSYTVRLRVYLSSGTICNFSKTNYIQVSSKPVAQFTVDKPILCFGSDTVTFTDITPKTKSRDWLIDGVSYINGPKVLKHCFKLSGYKSVSLTMRDSIGCSASVNSDSVVVVIDTPTIDFLVSDTMGCSPLSVTFSPLISGLTSQTITAYSWSLVGSSIPISSNFSPTVNYTTQGNFDVQLSITTNFGCTYTKVKPAFVKVGSPITISFQANNTSVCRGQIIQIVNTTVGLPMPGAFTWSLPTGATITQGNLNTDTIWIKFNSLGSYNMALDYNYNGCKSTMTYVNYFTVNPPVANFTSFDRINCTFPDTVNITSTSTLPSTGTNTWDWIVYDEDDITVLDASNAQHPQFIINKYGSFAVQLIVKNSNGCSDTLLIPDFIIVDTVAGKFNAFPKIACPGQPITFSDLTPVFSNKAPKQYRWTFYSLDSIHTLDFSSNGNDTISNPTVKYDTVGFYNVRLIIFNKFGCVDTVFEKKFIQIGYPLADYSKTDSNICVGSTVKFIQQTNPSISSLVHFWEIQHQDSINIKITGTGGIFVAQFDVPGLYSVKYKGTNGIYCEDSTIKTGDIKVSGIKGDISSNKTTGCVPSSINFNSSILYNFHYVNPSNAVQYSWVCQPISNGATSSGYAMATPNASATSITFTESGTYIVYCIFTNSEGCIFSDSAKGIIINFGIKASFNVFPVFCRNDTGVILNTSKLSPVSYKWYSNGAITFLPSDTSTNPTIVFNQNGYHPISLIAKSIDGCVDTSTQYLVITKPTADFISNDTVNICGPVLVNFKSRSSSDVTVFTWDFGDGSPPVVTNDTIISHVFAIKNGQSMFTITLSVENNFGCKDIIMKQNYIRLMGPVPYFVMSNTKGCEPLNVNIVDSSRNAFKFYFNYGFGPDDSISITNKTYMLSSPNVPYSVYKPYLFVTDASGSCFQIYQPLDSIVVYANPKAYFYVNMASDCAPFSVNFIDTSVGATRWKWDFNDDGLIDDTTQNPTYSYVTPGKYSVKLFVTNQFGCTDSVIKADFINAFAKPVAKFSLSDSTICPKTAVSFFDQSVFVSPSMSYHWDFGVTTTLSDTSNSPNPAPFVYDVPGLYTVKLVVQDIQGCSDSVIKTNLIQVFDSLPPSQPQIYYVTVVGDNDIKIVWNKNSATDFTNYNLYRSLGGAFSPLISKNLIADTTFTDNSGINVKTQSYFYNMDADDNCNYKTLVSTTHKSIYLDATTLTQNSNFISWSGYQGWMPGTFTYKLFRSHTYSGGYSLYAQLTSADTTFTDANLCDSDYYYYVEAWQVGTNFISRSNIDFNHPPFYIPNIPLEVIRATVINDKEILLEWDTSGILNTNRKNYLIDKMDPAGNFQSIAISTSNSYIDKAVDVHSKSYTYRVRMQDYCGNINPGSNIGRSINLKVTNTGYNVNLAWNTYGDWSNSIQAYILEFYDKINQSFMVAAVLPPTDSSYTDTKFYKTDTAYCYRIKAVEAIQATPDTSMSNVACVFLPPNILVPNAFSPNNDGLNDVFYAQGVFIQNLTGKPPIDYLLRVYDRWGMLLFETNDLNKGWDGTYNGAACEIGVYVYELRATGTNRQRFNYKGTFQLLR